MSWYNPGNVIGHALNAAQNTVEYGSLHAPKSVTTPDLGTVSTNDFGAGFGGGGGAPAGQAATSNTQQQSSANQMASGGGTGGGAAGGGGGTTAAASGQGAAAPASGTNANGGATNFLSSMFMPALGQLQSAYTSLFGNGQPGQGEYGQAAGNAAANVQQNYGSQQGALNSGFAQAQNQQPWELVGRGAGSSSFADNANQYAQQQYNNSLQGLNAGEAKDLGSIAQSENAAQGQYQGYLNAFNNPQFQAALNNDPSYIQSEQYGTLQQDLAAANQMQGQQTPLPTAIAQLQNNPTYQQAGSANIASQLQSLAGSPTTSAAQNQIAQGIVGNSTNPQSNVWSNYWNQLQQNPNAAPPAGA